MDAILGRVIVLGSVLVGCANTPVGDSHRGSIRESDGTYAFYGGVGIGDVLAREGTVSDNHPKPFMRLRVSAAFVDAALAAPQRAKTVSFEVPDASIEATVHKFIPATGTLETMRFRPGDPWVSGFAQVAVDGEGVTMGFFEIIKWSPVAQMSGVLAKNVYTTGVLSDSNLPVLRYANDPLNGSLPDNWK
jgi:hypothetical protein